MIDKDLKSLRIVLIGPPGGGKGTQARILQEKTGIPHISTGEIFRSYARAGTELGLKVKSLMDKGLLVPDDLTLEIIEDRLFGSQESNKQGCILDGFPRTVTQAEVFGEILDRHDAKIDFAINIKVANDYIIERITGRFACARCGEMYHDKFKMPKIKGICDVCGAKKFVRRVDDTVEVVQERLNKYRELTEPLLPYYEEKGVLCTVDGVGDITQVADSIFKVIGLR